MDFRIGQGFDCHQLIEGFSLIIGGVSIEYTKGSKGHSDGDVLYHALTDALFGSINAGDIGVYFPSTDPQWKYADSSIFVKHACKTVTEAGYVIANIDSTVIIQQPKINPHIQKMKTNISEITQLNTDQISIKATTTDYLGFIGQSDGLCAIVSILINKSG